MSRTVEPLGSGEGRLALVRGLIVTANRDGSVPLNSRVLVAWERNREAAARQIVDAFNALAEACEALAEQAATPDSHEHGAIQFAVALSKAQAALALAKGEK